MRKLLLLNASLVALVVASPALAGTGCEVLVGG